MPDLPEDVVLAAGGIVHCASSEIDRVALVHRPNHADWSLPKGKPKEGESLTETALREVREETGADPRLGEFAGVLSYPEGGRRKVVLFWHMTAPDTGAFSPSDEVDRVEWLPLSEAVGRLSYANQRSFLVESARRLRAELEFNRIELEHLIDSVLDDPEAAAAPWAEAARALYEAAHSDLEEGRVDDGWRAFHSAQRMTYEGLAQLDDADGLNACAAAVRNESEKKLTGWRRDTVRELIGKPDKHPELSTSPSDVFKVSLSARVLHEHFSNVYHTVDGLRRQIAWLLGVGLVSLGAWVLFGLDGLPGPAAEAPSGLEPALVPSVMLFGAMGGAVSGILSLAKKSSRGKIPEQLVSAWFTLSRPLVGAVTAVVVYIALVSQVLSLGEMSTELALLTAFATGFSERLLERAVGAASGSSQS